MIETAGTRIEPLAHRPMTRTLLFIDGTRAEEVRWALAQVAPTRIVLLSGRPLDLARAHARVFYYDQGGTLATRFGLKATPARIRQEGLKLRIDELVLPDREHTAGSFPTRIPHEETHETRRTVGVGVSQSAGRSPPGAALLCATLLGATLLLGAALVPGAAHAQACTGRFVNPLTDVCWECLFPISIGSVRIGSAAGAPDTPNPSSPICNCGLRIGLSIGLWAPARLIDVSRTPYCFSNWAG